MFKINSLYEASFNPLNREAEFLTAQKMKNGDASARETLIRANIRFALSEARKYQGHGLSWEDLCSEATTGLVKAVDHFDLNHNVRLITCAVYWIRNEILTSINKCGYTPCISLDAPAKNKNDECGIGTFLSMLSDSENIRPEEAAINVCFQKEFYKTLNALEYTDKWIFILHNGIAGYKTHSFSQIGEKFGHTKQWAYLKEKSVERHLSEVLKDWIA